MHATVVGGQFLKISSLHHVGPRSNSGHQALQPTPSSAKPSLWSHIQFFLMCSGILTQIFMHGKQCLWLPLRDFFPIFSRKKQLCGSSTCSSGEQIPSMSRIAITGLVYKCVWFFVYFLSFLGKFIFQGHLLSWPVMQKWKKWNSMQLSETSETKESKCVLNLFQVEDASASVSLFCSCRGLSLVSSMILGSTPSSDLYGHLQSCANIHRQMHVQHT